MAAIDRPLHPRYGEKANHQLTNRYMEREEDIVPDLEGSDENRFDRNGQSRYPKFVPDPNLEEVPDTPETRAHHRRVIRAIQESTGQDQDEQEAESEAKDDHHEYPPQEPRG